MSNLDSMYDSLNKDIDSYNDMVYFSNNYYYTDTNLVKAYNEMIDAYKLYSCFTIDGDCIDGNALKKQHQKILDLINDIRKERNQMQSSMNSQMQNINEQKSRIESDRARQSKGN